MCLELTWSSKAVQNQTYKADIDLFFVIRSIADKKMNAGRLTNSISKMVEKALTLLKYEFKEFDVQEYIEQIGSIRRRSQAIVKHELSLESTAPMIDAIYSFGHISDSDVDFSNIVNTMSSYPNSVIHFQLIPTKFNQNERNLLSSYLQSANIASKGVLAKGLGQISFSQANIIIDTFQTYYEQISSPMFKFNIIVRGSDEDTDQISSQIVGLLNSDPVHPISFDTLDLSDSIFEGHQIGRASCRERV